MNDEEIRTAEYIIRSEKKDDAAAPAKSKLIARIVLGILAAVVIFSGIATATAKANTKEESIEGLATTVTESVLSAASSNEALWEAANRVYAIVKEAQQAEKEQAEIIEAIGEFITVDSSELVGILGNTSDIMEAYRADDPELPPYLSYSYNSGYRLDLSEEEITLLSKIIEAEAPSEDIYGKILVANVVLNRVLSEGWPNTVTEVVYQRCGDAVQFSSTMFPYYWNSIVISDSSREAAMRALAGEDYSKGAQFFYGWKELPELGPNKGWVSIFPYLFTHGCHAFHR